MSRISDVLISHSLKSLVYDVYERYKYAEIDMRRDLLTHLTRCAHGVWFLDIAAVVVGFDIAYDDLETTVWVVSWTCVWHDARPYGVIHPLISWFTHNMSLLTLFSCSAAHFVLMLCCYSFHSYAHSVHKFANLIAHFVARYTLIRSSQTPFSDFHLNSNITRHLNQPHTHTNLKQASSVLLLLVSSYAWEDMMRLVRVLAHCIVWLNLCMYMVKVNMSYHHMFITSCTHQSSSTSKSTHLDRWWFGYNWWHHVHISFDTSIEL